MGVRCMRGTGLLPLELFVAYLFAHSSRLPSCPRSGAEEVQPRGARLGIGPWKRRLRSKAGAEFGASGCRSLGSECPQPRRVAAGRVLGWALESPFSVFSTWCNAKWCSRNVAEPVLEIAAKDPSP